LLLVLICRRETLRFETLAAWYPNLPKVLDALSSSGSPSTLTCTLTLLPPNLNEGGKEGAAANNGVSLQGRGS